MAPSGNNSPGIGVLLDVGMHPDRSGVDDQRPIIYPLLNLCQRNRFDVRQVLQE